MAKKRRSKFEAPAVAEREYERQLRKVARAVAAIIEPYVEGATIPQLPALLKQLQAYSDIIGPWATRVAESMLEKVRSSDKRAWRAEDKKFTQGFRSIVGDTAVGRESVRLLGEQVGLIKSLPTKAGERAQQLAVDATINVRRANDVAADLRNIGNVTEARAMLIARTEIAKANSTMTQARSAALGSSAYIWRTAGDEAVRESHAEMEGEVVRWDQPPLLSDGTVTHAGQIYNCRCYAEPILPDLDE